MVPRSALAYVGAKEGLDVVPMNSKPMDKSVTGGRRV